MQGLELAELVEYSEARAYASLIQAAPKPFLERHGLLAFSVDSAVALVSPPVTNTLNMNRVIGLGVSEPATEAIVGKIVQLYGDHGLSFAVEVGPFARPKEIAGWLRARRIRRAVATAMHYRVANPVEAGTGPLSAERAPHSARQIVADICCQVFRMPPTVHTLIAGTADIPGWRHWIAYAGDRPVAAALSYVSDGVAWFGWDATLPEFRGRGAQSSLIVQRLNDAARAGCRYVTTETAMNTKANTDPSYVNYERLGFSLAYERATYVALRGAGKSGAEAR